MKPRFLAFPLLAIALSPSLIAGAFVWTGASNATWTDATSIPLNWDIVSTTPVSTDTYPNYGSTYADDFLNIRNNGDLLPPTSGSTPGAGAVYDPGAGVTTTFNGGRCFVIGTGTPGTKGFASLEVKSGTIVGARTTNAGSEPYMANRADTTLLINGGSVDLSAHSNNFRLIQEGMLGITSTITLDSGSLSCRSLDLIYDDESKVTPEPQNVFGNGIVNVNGGTFSLLRFVRTAASDPGQTAFTLNLNGGTLRAVNTQTDFLNALADLQTLVKAGGAKIDTNAFNITIAEALESGAATDGGLTKNNTGNLTLSGSNTYNGGTTINAGAIVITSDANLGASTGGITFNAAGGESSLFVNASVTDSNRTVTLASTATGNIRMNAANPFTNAGKFTGAGNLRFNQTGSGFCTATLAAQNNDFSGSLTIDQNGSNSNAIRVIVNSLADPIGAGNIICKSIGTSAFPAFRLGADAEGAMTLTNRRIELAGPMGTGSSFTLSSESATHAITINSNLLVSGTAGIRRLSLSGVAGPVNVFDGDIADETGSVVSVTKTGGATWTLSGSNNYTGGTTLSGTTAGSQLNLNSPTALGTGTFSISGGDNGKINNTSGAAITLSTNNAQAWNNNFAFVGSNDLNLGTGAVTLGGNRTIFAQGSTLTVGGAISGAFGITKSSGGTMVLTGASTYTGGTTIAQGSLSVNSIKDYGVSSALGAPLTGVVQLGAANNFCTLIYTGGGDSTNRTVQLGNTTAANDGVGAIRNNGSGALTFTAANFNPVIPGITATRTLWLGGTYTGTPNEIQGIIQDHDTAGKVSIAKAMDTSIWTLSGANTYTGSTLIQAGAIKLGATGSISNSTALTIGAAGTLDTSAQATHTIPATQTVAFGIDATGSGSSGRIAAAGLNISAAVVTYNITGTPDDPVYVLATYTPGQLTGTFASVPAPPSGYTLNYAYEGNKIALVQGAVSGYAAWQAANGNTIGGLGADHDDDGVDNGTEYFLFGNASSTGFTPLPGVTDNAGVLSVTWTKAAIGYAGSYGSDFVVEISDTLTGWTPVTPPTVLDPQPAGTVKITGNDVKYIFPSGTGKFARLKVTGP